MNPAIARPELTGEAAISVSTWRWKISPTKEPGAGEMMLTFGPGFCARPVPLTAANPATNNNSPRNGAILKTASVNRVARSAERWDDADVPKLFAHNGSGYRYASPNITR
jgi:hypothetical protein